MKKIIGITASRRDPLNGGEHKVNMKYTELLIESGYTPVIIPVGADIDSIIDLVDGMIFSGGQDIHPMFYGQNVKEALTNPDLGRDKYELELYEKMKEIGKPILGICRGFQLFLVAENFALSQDLRRHPRVFLCHEQDIERTYPSHYVTFNLSNEVYHYTKFKKPMKIKVYGYSKNHLVDIFDDVRMVNSMHHQGLHIVAFAEQFLESNKNVIVLGMAEDGIIEAIEVEGYKSKILAVQFHPEESKDIKLIQKVFA